MSILTKDISEILNFGNKQFREKYENVFFWELILWVLLPIFVLPFAIYEGLSGNWNGIMYAWFSYVHNIYTNMFFILGAITLISVVFYIIVTVKKINLRMCLKEVPWLFFFVCLLVWCLITSLLADEWGMAFRGNGYRVDGYISYLIYAAVFVCAIMLKNTDKKLKILRLFIFVSTVLCALMIGEASGISLFTTMFPNPRASVFNQFNHFGYYICMSLLATVGLFLYDTSKNLKIVYGLILAIQTYALIVNDTFGCYLAAAAAFILIYVYFIVRTRKLSFISLIPLLVFVCVSLLCFFNVVPTFSYYEWKSNFIGFVGDIENVVDDPTSSESAIAGTGRMGLWLEALRWFVRRPIFGYGPEGLSGIYTQTVGVDRPHNEFIQCLVFHGIPGLLFYLLGLITLAVQTLKKIKLLPPVYMIALGCVTGYLISSCFGNTMFNTAPYFWMFMGLVASNDSFAGFIKTTRFARKKKTSKILKIVLSTVISLVIAALVVLLGIRQIELRYEDQDIANMNLAYTKANEKIVIDKISEDTTLYFDDDSGTLVSSKDEIKDAYGAGTTQSTGGDSYNVNDAYEYDQDYLGKIIQVTIKPNELTEKIILEWVEY